MTMHRFSSLSMHENTLRLRHMEIERGPEMFRLYNFRCEHCLAWSADMCSLPCCDNCGSMVCKDCITASSWQEPDEGDWGRGECKRCARFMTNTRTKMTWFTPMHIAASGWHLISCALWFTEQNSYSVGGWVELGAPLQSPPIGTIMRLDSRTIPGIRPAEFVAL